MKKIRWAIGILAAAAVLAVGTAANEAVELEETVVEAETAVTAEATEGDYTYTVSNGTATITGFSESGDVEIPSSLGGYPVTKIGVSAFSCRKDITSVVIPKGVTSIEINAFYECEMLESVELPDGLASIGNSAFFRCTNLANINIPDSVTSIGSLTFQSCNSLKAITLPENVISIGNGAFKDCQTLNRVIIPKTITSLLNCFSDCPLLKTAGPIGGNYNIQFGWSTEIPSHAFAGTKIESIQIPASVTTIGSSAFSDCENLTEITLPDGIKEINEYTFQRCIGLEKINIPQSVRKIGKAAFSNCTSLTNVILPDKLTTIDDRAFQNCMQLSGVKIPKSVVNLTVSAFNGCISLKTMGPIGGGYDFEIDLNTSIPPYTFSSLEFTDITIAGSTTSIGTCAFENCPNLVTLTIGKNVRIIDSFAFRNCRLLTKVVISGDRVSLSMGSFQSAGMPSPGSPSELCVYFEGDAPSSVYNPNDAYPTFPETVTLYYREGTKGWTDSTAYNAAEGTWHGYKLLPYTAAADLPDLSLLAESHHSGIVTVTLDNLGNIPADATVNIYANNKNGALLHTESVTLAAGETTEIDFTLTDTSVKKVFVTVTAEDEDIFPDDNLDYCRVSWASAEPYDFTGDGEVNIDDALALFRYSMLPTVYPIPMPW